MKPFRPPRDGLPNKLALWATLSDLHDLIALIEAVDDEATCMALKLWMSQSRLKELWDTSRPE